MLTRFVRRFGLSMSVCLLAAATAGPAMAEAPVRADEGKVEAIEIYRAPDNKPVNGGTVIGGIAGGVIGHQIAISSPSRGERTTIVDKLVWRCAEQPERTLR